MPFIFIIVGVVLVISGVRGTSSDLVTLVKGDFTGSDNFIYWVLAIGAIGALGYVQNLKDFSNALLALVIISLILREQKNGAGGFFASFTSAVKTITAGSETT